MPRWAPLALPSLLVLLGLSSCAGAPQPQSITWPPPGELRGLLLDATGATPDEIARARAEQFNLIVVRLGADVDASALQRAATTVISHGALLGYWIEVARDPTLAETHREWIPTVPGPTGAAASGAALHAHPWVPILYRDAFRAQLLRVRQLLRGTVTADAVFLNDLQGAPSACGCGNALCRWTVDHGAASAATPAREPAGAAARFVAAVQESLPRSRVVPVWTPECEPQGACCQDEHCWKEMAAEWEPLVARGEDVGVLLARQSLGRDPAGGGDPADWIGGLLARLAKTAATPSPSPSASPATSRMIAVLEGHGVPRAEIRAQIDGARKAGVGSYVLSMVEIPQGVDARARPRTGG